MSRPALLVVTGLQREAQIAAGEDVMTVCSGSHPLLLRERLSNFSIARPRQRVRAKRGPMTGSGGDPEQKDWIPAYAGMSGERSGVSGVLSFGLAGGLAADLRPGDVVLASHVIEDNERHDVHPDWHATIAAPLENAMRVRRGGIVGHGAVLTKAADKAALHERTKAIAVDMESHIAAAYAREHNLPFAVIRVVSDPAARSLPQIASDALRPDGNVDLAKVLGGLMRKPGQLPALIAAGIDSERAFASLRRVRRLLGPLFGLRLADL